MFGLLRRLSEATWTPVVAVTLSVVLVFVVVGHHPQLSRQEAINAALTKQQQQTMRYAAKLVLESELEKADPESGHDTSPDYYVWVIAVSGDYGIHGEYPTPITWGAAMVKDERPARLMELISGGSGDWPPFFDQLIDRG